MNERSCDSDKQRRNSKHEKKRATRRLYVSVVRKETAIELMKVYVVPCYAGDLRASLAMKRNDGIGLCSRMVHSSEPVKLECDIAAFQKKHHI